jgi:hypothetical protein
MLANQLFTKSSRQANDHATEFHHKDMELKVDAERQEEADHESFDRQNLAAMTDKAVD